MDVGGDERAATLASSHADLMLASLSPTSPLQAQLQDVHMLGTGRRSSIAATA